MDGRSERSDGGPPADHLGQLVGVIGGSSISGPPNVPGTTGLRLVGGGSAYPSGAGTTINRPASFSNDIDDTEVNGNTISGPLSFSHDTGGMHQSGNTVSGPITIH